MFWGELAKGGQDDDQQRRKLIADEEIEELMAFSSHKVKTARWQGAVSARKTDTKGESKMTCPK
eukprot:1700614-Prorocentrum_lima.AAC.1